MWRGRRAAGKRFPSRTSTPTDRGRPVTAHRGNGDRPDPAAALPLRLVETVRVRTAGPGDAERIRALGPRLAEGAAPWRPAEAFAKAAQRWLDQAVDGMSADRPVWVAEHGGRVVGVVAAALSTHFTGEQDCYLGELAVAEDYEGRGVGRALVAVVERWATERGVTRVTLETGGANRRARGFYGALGYAEEQVQLTKVLRVGAAQADQ